jgi:septal ring-binding cell division protein DamX
MFIFNRPMAPVVAALGIAFLTIGLERVCDRLSASEPQAAAGLKVDSTAAAMRAPAAAATPAPTAAATPAPALVAQLVPLQGNRCQSTSSPSRLQRNPETLPSGVRWKILRSRGCPGTNSTS